MNVWKELLISVKLIKSKEDQQKLKAFYLKIMRFYN